MKFIALTLRTSPPPSPVLTYNVHSWIVPSNVYALRLNVRFYDVASALVAEHISVFRSRALWTI